MYIRVSLIVFLMAALATASPVGFCSAPSTDYPTSCQIPDGQTGICQSTDISCPAPGFNVAATGCPEEGEVSPGAQIPY